MQKNNDVALGLKISNFGDHVGNFVYARTVGLISVI
jgi:hypothetical protein